MKHPVTIGVVCLARTTFDYRAAASLYEGIKERLTAIPDVLWECIPELVIEIADAQQAAAFLSARQIDGLICISGTFHLGHLVLELDKVLHTPILLWGLPELPYDGGKIRLNSVCGLNLNASNLYKSGVRNYHAHIGAEIDEDWIDAVRVLKALASAHVGLAGYRAHGFFNLSVSDIDLYRTFGVLIDHYELQEIFDQPVEVEALSQARAALPEIFDCTALHAAQLDQVAALTVKLRAFMDRHGLTALALRCWPEFAAAYGIAPCAAMSLLQSEGRILACEGDIEGALSMIAHRAAGAETPYLFDFSQVNFEEDYALLWHCGVAPCNLRDGSTSCTLDTYFAGGKGVTAGFVLKPGDVSILRFDAAAGIQRVFLQSAHGLPMDKALSGTYLKVVFDTPVRTVLDKIISNGIAHHASMVYGAYIRPFEILARIKGWEVIS